MTIETQRAQARKGFVEMVERWGNDIPVDEAAAWLDAEERGIGDISETMGVLDTLAAGIAIPSGAGIFEKVARLNHQLFTTHGFSGAIGDYDAPDNSMLGQVLEQRAGLPVLLSIIYIAVAKRCGVAVDGIGFPTHFMVSPRDTDPRFFIDPFHEGRVLRMDHLRAWFQRIRGSSEGSMPSFEVWIQPINGRMLMVRMNNNLKRACMLRRDLEGALRAVERLLILMPDALDARRDRGLLRLELGQEEEGAADVDAYLAAHGGRGASSGLSIKD